MQLTRRKFLQLGAASAGFLALEGQFGVLSKAFGDELIDGGKDVSGGKAGEAGAERKAIPGTCLQCGVTDGLLGFVENNRIVKLEGNPKHPNSRGRLCAKGQAGLQQVYDPHRIQFPMKRVGKRGENKWKRISHQEAVDDLVKRLTEVKESGDPGRFVFHQGRNRFGAFVSRWVKAFGTGHHLNHTSLCEASLKVGYETSFGQDLDAADAARAKYIIAWGENIYEAAYMHNPLVQRIVEGRVDNNAKMVAVDPRLSNTAGAADEWVPLEVGTDAALMLAMCNVILEEGLADEQFINEWTNYPVTRLSAHLKQFTPEWAENITTVPAATIRRLAVEFATNQPGYARAYNGISNHHNGAYNARCLALLNAVVGNLDKEGGFCLMKFSGFGGVDPEPPDPEGSFPLRDDDTKNFPLAGHHTDHLLPHRINDLGYKIKVYMLHMYNPLYANPDQELWADVLMDPDKVEFIVDFSPFWSETAMMAADLIIPDCSFLEKFMINDMPPVENFPFVHLYQPVIEPLYESQSMYETLLEVAKEVPGMARFFAFDSVEEYCKQATENKWGPGSWDRLKSDGALIGSSYKPATYKSFDELTPEELAAARQFETYKQVLSAEDIRALRAEGAQFPSGDGPIKDSGGKTRGVVKDGVAYTGFPTGSGLFEIFSPGLEEHGFNPLPVYEPIPRLQEMADDDMHLLTGKWNVHTQSRTANCSWLLEIKHHNPAWINPATAKSLGIADGDEIEIESQFGVKKLRTRALLTEGIHPKCVFVSTSLGHWEYGDMASKGLVDGKPIWWAEQEWPGPTVTNDHKGRTTVGWTPNSILPNDEAQTDPIGGEYAWNDTPVKVRKA